MCYAYAIRICTDYNLLSALQKQFIPFHDDPTAPIPSKKRRKKPTKKCNCPAIVHIREVVMFPDFSILDSTNSTKSGIRQEKSQQILHLRKQMYDNLHINVFHRFYVSVPLPETHKGMHNPRCQYIKHVHKSRKLLFRGGHSP